MAKQSGLHQIRGKVGEHSYYKQTGITAGLIRSINQGLSSRVKDSDEYANTRLNNAEFGGAASVAGALGSMVVPKYRPMILPFSQSKMAKKILELAKQNAGVWGQRVVSASDTERLAEILTEQSKLRLDDFATVGVNLTSATEGDFEVTVSVDQISMMLSLGIDALSLTAVQIDLATGKYSSVTKKIQKSFVMRKNSAVVLDNLDLTPGSTIEFSEGFTYAPFNPPHTIANGHQLVVFVLMPLREVNDVYHVLQEYCSFKAIKLPDYE